MYGAGTFMLRKLADIYLDVFKMWLQKNGQNQLDRSRGKRRSITKSQGGEERAHAHTHTHTHTHIYIYLYIYMYVYLRGFKTFWRRLPTSIFHCLRLFHSPTRRSLSLMDVCIPFSRFFGGGLVFPLLQVSS